MKLKKLILYNFILLLSLFSLFLISISIGGSETGVKMEIGRILNFLKGQSDEIDRVVILHLRFPRILTSIFSGGGLAVAGAILQAIIRNPLASLISLVFQVVQLLVRLCRYYCLVLFLLH
ncbi:FecCD transport family protein [Candidatus Kryptonium thompsonii]|nr:FecCD transport family protein [Candidatus Kryptonium thompsoni]